MDESTEVFEEKNNFYFLPNFLMKQYLLNDWRKLEIKDWEWYDDPRKMWDYLTKLCIREHRRYDYPNELDYDFDCKINNLTDIYYVFPLDCYEHSGIVFSLAWKGMQCQFDTASNVWFMAVPKEYDGKTITEEEAEKIVISEIKEYNQYINNECYRYETYTPEVWTNSKGELKTDRELQDACDQYLDEDDILSEFEKYEPKEIQE